MLENGRREPVLSEIEVFVSPKGHVTKWHYDFQQNITLQLTGSKRWRMKRSGILHPLRGCTPHYNESEEVIELQHRAHQLASDGRFHFEREPDQAFFEDADVVELTAGSVLFHPPGYWHQVECTEDSLSINFSFVATSWGDLIAQSLRHLLSATPAFRAPIHVPFPLYCPTPSTACALGSSHALLTRLLADAAQTFSCLSADMVLPAPLLDWHQRSLPLSHFATSKETNKKVNKKEIPKHLRFNPLAVVTLQILQQENDDEEEKDSSDEEENVQIACQIAFIPGGNSELKPVGSVVLLAPQDPYQSLLSSLLAQRVSLGHAVNKKALYASFSHRSVTVLLYALNSLGFLLADCRKASSKKQRVH